MGTKLTKREMDGLKYYAALENKDRGARHAALLTIRHPSNDTKASLEHKGLIVAVGENSKNSGILFRITEAGKAAMAGNQP